MKDLDQSHKPGVALYHCLDHHRMAGALHAHSQNIRASPISSIHASGHSLDCPTRRFLGT